MLSTMTTIINPNWWVRKPRLRKVGLSYRVLWLWHLSSRIWTQGALTWKPMLSSTHTWLQAYLYLVLPLLLPDWTSLPHCLVAPVHIVFLDWVSSLDLKGDIWLAAWHRQDSMVARARPLPSVDWYDLGQSSVYFSHWLWSSLTSANNEFQKLIYLKIWKSVHHN